MCEIGLIGPLSYREPTCPVTLTQQFYRGKSFKFLFVKEDIVQWIISVMCQCKGSCNGILMHCY